MLRQRCSLMFRCCCFGSRHDPRANPLGSFFEFVQNALRCLLVAAFRRNGLYLAGTIAVSGK